MNMKISGSGVVPAGEYDDIKTSGSSRLLGEVRCESLCTSGMTRAESLFCRGKIIGSGKSLFSGSVCAKKIKSSGNFYCAGDIRADSIESSGSIKCKSKIKSKYLNSSGVISASQIEAENVTVYGALRCEGLLNAENVEIISDGKCIIGSIGGSKITVKPRRWIFSFFKRRTVVKSTIEGDEITLKKVICPRVSGRAVIVRGGCIIDLLQYSEKIEIARGARVKRIEKVDC